MNQRSITVDGISHVLLDIEGTTCPVGFVTDVLFPYASERLGNFLELHGSEPPVQTLVAEVDETWRLDGDPEAICLRGQGDSSVLPYLQWLIRKDRKLTALKELQGLVWERGYLDVELQGPLFPDVPEALASWRQAGLLLAVYSSGSVAAQQLIYGYSNAGDLRPLFQHWFDTRIGPKQEVHSYQCIAAAMNTSTDRILFISDALSELQAAAGCGMKVLFSEREGNPDQLASGFRPITCFTELTILPG